MFGTRDKRIAGRTNRDELRHTGYWIPKHRTQVCSGLTWLGHEEVKPAFSIVPFMFEKKFIRYFTRGAIKGTTFFHWPLSHTVQPRIQTKNTNFCVNWTPVESPAP